METTSTTSALVPVTRWSRKSEEGWEHNHLEDGHVAPGTARPAPKHENHKSAWKRGDWRFELVYLTQELPPRVVSS